MNYRVVSFADIILIARDPKQDKQTSSALSKSQFDLIKTILKKLSEQNDPKRKDLSNE